MPNQSQPFNLATIIRSRRENIGLSQNGLARKLEIDRTTLARWESGRGKPSHDMFVKICTELSLEIKDFI